MDRLVLEACVTGNALSRGAQAFVFSAQRHATRGFSLMELMIVMLIAGVLMGFAVPAFTEFMQTSRLRSASSGLYEALVMARSEAIKRGASVAVSPAAGGWVDGWSVKSGTTTLKVWQPEAGLTYRDCSSCSGDITYGLNGRIGGAREIVIYSASSTASAARCVTIDAGGRVSTRIDKDGDQSNGC